jgi:prepilin peptidase CpaA
LLHHSQVIVLLSLTVPVALTGVASGMDLRNRVISNWIPLAVVAWATLATIMKWNGIGWWGYGVGLAIGLVVCVLMFASGGFGGGDAKLLAALGAALGWQGFLITLLLTTLAGGLLAVVAKLKGRRDYAYGPAIAAGALGYAVLWVSVAWILSSHRGMGVR